LTFGFLIISAWLVAACGPSAPPKDQAAPDKALDAQERVTRYEQCWSHFNQQNWTAFKSCYADNATSQLLGYGKATVDIMYPGDGRESVTGPDAIAGSVAQFATEYPDTRGVPQLILSNGERIASIYFLSGTASGPTSNPHHRDNGKERPPSKRPFGVLLGHAVEMDGAMRVTAEVGFVDTMTLLSQLGVRQPSAPALKGGDATPVIVIATDNETESKNVEVVSKQLTAWNAHALHDVESYLADDLVFRGASFGWSEFPHPGRGRTAPKDHKAAGVDSLKALWRGFTDAKVTAHSVWGAGDYVVVRGTLSGTNDGLFRPMNLENSGRKIFAPFMEIDRLESGKVKESWFMYDSGSFIPLNYGRR
jgi:ketosteroid isomerase-like protein